MCDLRACFGYLRAFSGSRKSRSRGTPSPNPCAPPPPQPHIPPPQCSSNPPVASPPVRIHPPPPPPQTRAASPAQSQFQFQNVTLEAADKEALIHPSHPNTAAEGGLTFATCTEDAHSNENVSSIHHILTLYNQRPSPSPILNNHFNTSSQKSPQTPPPQLSITPATSPSPSSSSSSSTRPSSPPKLRPSLPPPKLIPSPSPPFIPDTQSTTSPTSISTPLADSPTSSQTPTRRVPLPSTATMVPSLPRRYIPVSHVPPRKHQKKSKGVPTFVMMPLDFALDDGWLSSHDALHGALSALKHSGVSGIMVDVWWGVCEKEAQVYDFSKYLKLAEACRNHGLRMQAVMAFHACGGNVGDNVNIELPRWVCDAADKNEAWFRDRSYDGTNREYLSFGADHCAFLPTVGGGPSRTPIQAYASFVHAFCTTFQRYSSTVTEIQVGMGPCGELRYPSYPLGGGKWRFPGIGELQCFDKHLLDSLCTAARRENLPVEWAYPPKDTGVYNSKVNDEVPFYSGKHLESRGRFFLKWYSSVLLQHCEDLLLAIGTVHIDVAVKVAGIHWGYLTQARAAEANAGYYVTDNFCFYDEVVRVLAKYNAVLDFTCLEMASEHQPSNAFAAPSQLVHDVFEIAARHNVPVAGENALECYDVDSFKRAADSFKWTRAYAHGFTLLRLTQTLLESDNLSNVRKLTHMMRHCSVF